ncbi:hypothetical protein [Nesterenkonia xinjiangensis]|uniref:Uncharacterized protein n=1 Tax=Nesterenkonia xinjiangensis TaxID=225327 RepID=A0A7Z0GKH7_9MICC|nr:hypothetical protein [Nesterenkonia xinjiangensis]NYJ77696.1 hypothetical protein [Nesterenkonia xinjiangensis]
MNALLLTAAVVLATASRRKVRSAVPDLAAGALGLLAVVTAVIW